MPKAKCSYRNSKVVPYVKGFKRPSVKKQRKAIGFADESVIPNEFKPDVAFFDSVPKCSSISDWLAQYKEHGQTYHEFLSQCPWLSKRKVKNIKSHHFNKNGKTILEKYPNSKIYILPVGDFTKDDTCPNITDLLQYTQAFLGISVSLLPSINVQVSKGRVYFVQYEQSESDESNCSSHINDSEGCSNSNDGIQFGSSVKPEVIAKESVLARFHGNKYQIKVSGNSALMSLKKYVPDDALCVIALTMSDLYDEKPDLFVAGMASGNSRVAIFSLHRYDPNVTFSSEFWYDVRRKKSMDVERSKRTILLRGCRLLVHEISHLLGIDHCIYFACCMNGSGHLEEDFKQPMFLCPVDLRKLQTLVGFDVLQRYEQLLKFCIKHDFQEEILWLKKRKQYLEQTNNNNTLCDENVLSS